MQKKQPFSILNLQKLTLVIILCAYVNSHEECMSPRREKGFCVPIDQCKTILGIKARKNHQRQLNEFLRKTKCGHNLIEPHMCCDKSQVVYEYDEESVKLGMSILKATKCGKSGAPRVAYGKDAKLFQYPWMVQLVYDTDGKSTLECSGSLISEQYVLTAAHCIVARENLKKVLLGEVRTGNDPDCEGYGKRRKCAPKIQLIDVEEIICHKKFKDTHYSYDIGLIRLTKKAILNGSVQPICLPITPSSQVIPEYLIVAGWGRIENNLRAGVLQYATIPVQDNAFCKKKHAFSIAKYMFMCTGGESPAGACEGDSGGPTFSLAKYNLGARYIQYGIVSAGSKSCGYIFPSIDVNVVSFTKWIASNIRS